MRVFSPEEGRTPPLGGTEAQDSFPDVALLPESSHSRLFSPPLSSLHKSLKPLKCDVLYSSSSSSEVVLPP